MTGKVLAAFLVTGAAAEEERPPRIEVPAPGVTLTLVAGHPDIATPTGVDVDALGNVWAVACHTHMPPEDYAGPEYDEILVFDENGGRQVFYDGTEQTMDLELGPDGWVYLAERDRIFRIRDSDGDGRADEEQDLAVLETEEDYPHNALAGLAWHPDGSLYFGLGENFAQDWTLRARDGVTHTGRGEGGIFRCEPDGSGLERLARGMWNPFGLAIRDDGELFAVENDPGERPPCRLLHVLADADFGYQRAYGNGAHHPFVCWNGELRGTLPMTHPVGEGPCGVLALGRGLLATSWSDHRIDFLPLEPDGASYSAARIPIVTGGRYFRPVCLAPDPRFEEGTKRVWYVTDWVDGRYPVHGYGRLWKMSIDLEKAKSWTGALEVPEWTRERKLAEDLLTGAHSVDDGRLFDLAESPDAHLAHAALVALSSRSDSWRPSTVEEWSEGRRVTAALALRRAGADASRWIPVFLRDANPGVTFEALRWIADEVRVEFLPQVEELLQGGDVEFLVFEAAIAARNTLRGMPDKGVRDEELLLATVLDEAAAPRLRAYALRLLPALPRVAKEGTPPEMRFPKEITRDLLRDLFLIGDEVVSLEVARALSAAPVWGKTLLVEMAEDPHAPPRARATAVAGLAVTAGKHVDLLVDLASSHHRDIRDEALRSLFGTELDPSARERLEQAAKEFPDSAAGVGAVLEPAAIFEERPPFTDTDAWLARLDALPGDPDPEAGERIFFHKARALCANCHRYEGRGTVVGPDLSRVGDRADRTWLLTSILDPNREIAPEYQPRAITLKDGSTFTGIRLRSSTREAMRDANGQNRTFNRDDIVAMEELSMSLMPPGLPLALTDPELRDLLAFLENGAD